MRLSHWFVCLALTFPFTAALQPAVAKEVETLEIGSAAPELDLPGIDGKTYKPRKEKDGTFAIVITLIETRGEGLRLVRRQLDQAPAQN